MISPALYSSAKPDWKTPACVLEPLHTHFGGIGLDPCAHPDGDLVGATTRFVYPEQDGLVRHWTGHGLCWVNPPFGRALSDWAAKYAHEARAGAEIVLLAPARTDTRWFRVAWEASTAALFWAQRIRFEGAPAGAPFPTCLLYAGPRWARFLAAYEGRGIGVRP